MANIKAFVVVNNAVLATLPAAIQVPGDDGALVGGYTWVGRVATWHALLVTTTVDQLTAWDASAGAGCVVLVRLTDEGRVELDNSMDAATLTKLNTWLTARGFPTEVTATNRAIVRKLFRRFLSNFEFEQVDVN